VRATNVDLAGGRGQIGGKEQTIRTLAGARSVQELADSRIILPGGRDVRLADLGKVEDSNSEPRSFGRLNGQPVVAFSVFRAKGSSELSVKNVVEDRLKALRASHPDVTITPIDDAVAFTYGNYQAGMLTPR
jgi:multidrug efflux pump subunit AcrB